MKVFQIASFERHGAAEHGEEQDPEGPNVYEEALVALVDDDLWGKIRWGTALLLDDLTFLNDLGDAEVADLDSLLAVQKNIIKLDITVDD